MKMNTKLVYLIEGIENLIAHQFCLCSSFKWKFTQVLKHDFVKYVATDIPPPLSEGDTVLRDDLDWQLAAELYVAAKTKSDEISKIVDEAKSKLISLAKHNRESGCGVVVTRFWKQGNINYKAIPELGTVNLELYRGKSKEEVRVTVVKP